MCMCMKTENFEIAFLKIDRHTYPQPLSTVKNTFGDRMGFLIAS